MRGLVYGDTQRWRQEEFHTIKPAVGNLINAQPMAESPGGEHVDDMALVSSGSGGGLDVSAVGAAALETYNFTVAA